MARLRRRTRGWERRGQRTWVQFWPQWWPSPPPHPRHHRVDPIATVPLFWHCFQFPFFYFLTFLSKSETNVNIHAIQHQWYPCSLYSFAVRRNQNSQARKEWLSLSILVNPPPCAFGRKNSWGIWSATHLLDLLYAMSNTNETWNFCINQ